MPRIAPQRKITRDGFMVRLDVRLLAVLKAYAECIASGHDYLITEALLATFASDHDFRAWLAATHPADREALDQLLAERPRTNTTTRRTGKPVSRAVGASGMVASASAVCPPERG